MEMIDVKEWDAAFGGFTDWMAQIESDRINFELQLLADAELDRIVDEQYDAMVDDFIAEFDGKVSEEQL